jgi:hypothetical protein
VEVQYGHAAIVRAYGFPSLRAREREANQSVGVQRKSSAQKTKAPSAKEKSANSRFFLLLPQNFGNPVPESKATRHGEKKGSGRRCM